MTVKEIATGLVNAMINQGYTQRTAWTAYETAYYPIAKFHEAQGETVLSDELVAEFVRRTEKRLMTKEIGTSFFKCIKTGAERMLLFRDTGQIHKPRHGAYSCLNEYYQDLVDDFITNIDEDWEWGERSIQETKSNLNQHFYWLMQVGCERLQDVTAEILREFLVYCADKYQAQTLAFLKCRLKKIYAHWYQKEIISNDFAKIFSFPVRVPRKITPAPSQEEIASILSQIDRSKAKGKRDYTMVLLGTVTGLRRCDVARLKLTDIDWQRGEIRIVQHKTWKPIALPLTKDVGEALEDYIY
jgi:hypothetical protein